MTAPAFFLWRRVSSVRMLLVSVLVSTLIATALVTALSAFAARSLPEAIGADLARSPGTSIVISAQFGAAQASADQPAIRVAVRRALGTIPVGYEHGLWSDSIGYSTTGRTVTLVRAAALSHIARRASLVAGSWPAVPASGTQPARAPIPTAVPDRAAADLHLRLGQVIAMRDQLTGARVSFQISGLYRPDNSAATYWGVDLIGPSGVSVLPGFTTYGPFVVAPAAFAGGGLTVGAASWLVLPDLSGVRSSQLAPLAVRVRRMLTALSGSSDLGGLQLASGLPGTLSGAATELVVARSLLAVSEIELLLLVVSALSLSARTLGAQREEDLAMLAARGAGLRQLSGLALIEALVVGAIAGGAGVFLGYRLAGKLARSGTLRLAGPRVSGIPAQAWWAAATVTALCIAIMALPALRPASPGGARVRRGRRAMVAGAVRSGADVALLLLALLAGWQLRHYSVLRRGSGGLGVDPVLAIAPAVALAAATVLPLRLLPMLARGADRLASRTRRIGVALVSWELSRKAVRLSAPMLLVVLAVGTGTLALAQHQSWRQSTADQTAFAVGADVRADLTLPLPVGRTALLARASGVRAAMAVSTGLTGPSGGQALAVDTRRGPATVLLRADQSARPAAALWRLIRPAGLARPVALPGRPARLELIASLAWGPGPDLGPVSVTVAVQDGTGATFDLPAGLLPGDGRSHDLTVLLSARRQAVYPLALLSVSVQYPMPLTPSTHRARVAARSRIARLAVTGLAVSSAPSGAFARPLAAGQRVPGWPVSISADELALRGASGVGPAMVTASQARPGVQVFHPGYGQFTNLFSPPAPVSAGLTLTAPVLRRVVPAIATRAYLRSGHVGVGGVLQLAASQGTVTVKIVAVVGDFPTIVSPQGGLIVDERAVQDVLAAAQAPPLPVTQWWLATAGGRLPRQLPAGAVLTSRARLLAAMQSEPLAEIPQQAILLVALAAAVLAALGFSVAVAASIRERRSQWALLSALGVSNAARGWLFCLESLVLSGPAAGTGLLLGAILARLLVPAVTVTVTAATPVPPPIVVVPVAPAAALALCVAILPVLAAAAGAVLRPDPAATLRAAEAT